MFEEDFERCFICQQPCKGLYCSADCKQQDKGTPSPMVKAANPPVRLTAQLPVSLSPHVRPTHTIAPSPSFGARRRGNSSSSSSLSESPIQSPQTNPSTTDSPQKESFNLPPPAYPSPYSNFGSMPVKIPAGFASRVPSTTASAAATPGSHGTAYPTGTSIDTLRFGRKSSVTNSVTSPLALAPRCGCGRPLGHRARSGDRRSGRDTAEAISCLQLGPSLTTADDIATGARLFADPIYRTPRTPTIACCPVLPEERAINHVLGPSLLSRSRSDPASPSSPRTQRGIHPRPAPRIETSGRQTDFASPRAANAPLPPVTNQRMRISTAANTLPAPSDDRRGRSRERVPLRGDVTPDRAPKLLYHEEREVAPTRGSRSRGRGPSRDRLDRVRSRSRGNEIGLALNLGPAERGRAQRVYA